MKDLIIIGAGPGGLDLALAADKAHLSVLLIEAEEVGGTCLHHGCIPTKSLYQNAKVLKDLQSIDKFGVTIDSFHFDFNKVMQRKTEVIETLTKGIKLNLDKSHIELIYGKASLVSNHEVQVNDHIYEGKYIVIATGSKPIILNIEGASLDGVITSNEILKIQEIPHHLIIIGGGVIGIEMATIFRYLGSEVSIIEGTDSILPNCDKEISKRLTAYLKSQGINIFVKTILESISKNNQELFVKVSDPSCKINPICDKILMAVGRFPNIYDIGLDKVGINYTKKGIMVNDNFQTNLENIYAIGDCNGHIMLAHMATYSGYHVLNHILNRPDNINFNIIPNCVFTFPEVAMVGLTEEECVSKNIQYKTSKFLFRANGKALTMGEVDGFIKVITSQNKLMGVHILGPHASDLIHEASSLMSQDIDILKFVDIIHAHPTLSETLKETIKQMNEEE